MLVLWAVPGLPALAHGGGELTDGTAWQAWPLSPDIVIPTLLVALVYSTGIVRRATVAEAVPWWRHLIFFTGLAAVFLALQSPVDPLGERLFFVHQIQHLLLRMVGPMLIALAWPQGLLIAGTPSVVRQSVLAPLLANAAVRRAFGVIAHPVTATTIFIGALYFWQIPRYHDIALLNEPIHYVMHVTMLVAGLIFWWRIFDRRPAPQGLRYGVRLMMLWLVMLSNIILGAYTTLKSTVLYQAYDVMGRLFEYPPLADEKIGGIIIWIPSSMMCLIAILVVVHMWGRHETRLDQRRASGSRSRAAALTAEALIEQTRQKNRTLALGICAFMLAVFASALLVGVLSDLSGNATTAIEDGDVEVQQASHAEASSAATR